MLSEPDHSEAPRAAPRISLSAERLAPAAFDALLGGFDGAAHEVTACFAAERWPGMALEPLVFSHGSRPVAAALIMIWRIPVVACAMAVSKWGPVLFDEAAPDRDCVYEAALDHLVSEYAGRRRMMLSLMPRAEKDFPLEVMERLKRRGFWFGLPFPFPHFYFARVRLTDAEQRRSLGQKWRYHLKKAEGQGLDFEAGTAADLPRFQKLYDAMTKRKRFPDYSAYRTLPKVLANAPGTIRPRLFFVTKDGEDVAGAVVFVAGRTAAYLYGATNEKALPLRAGYFMQARILSWLRDNTRAEWYDLGGTDGFHGLHQFKKGLAGTAGVIAPVPPVANIAQQLRPRIIGRTIFALRHGLQRYRTLSSGLSRSRARPDQDRDA